MKIATGKVVGGKVELEGVELPRFGGQFAKKAVHRKTCWQFGSKRLRGH